MVEIRYIIQRLKRNEKNDEFQRKIPAMVSWSRGPDSRRHPAPEIYRGRQVRPRPYLNGGKFI